MDELDYQKTKIKKNIELLKTRETENALLKKLVKDYELFEQKIKEKELQRKMEEKTHEEYLSMIHAYINHIIEKNELTESGLNKMDYENRRILSMMDKIKNKISTI
jgi:hypothetical protein